MDILSSLIHDMQMSKQRMQQKRTALQLLTFSGVVRSSHVELRYATPIATITAFRAPRLAIKLPKSQLIPSRPTTHNITLPFQHTWQRLRSLPFILLLRALLGDTGPMRYQRRQGISLQLFKWSYCSSCRR